MNNKAYSRLRALFVLGSFTLLILVGRTEPMHAQSNRADNQAEASGVFEQAGVPLRSEASILISVNLLSGSHKFVGLGAKLPKSVEALSPRTFGKAPFALVVTESDETFIRPIALRAVDQSNVTVVVPFSRGWGAREIIVSGILPWSGSEQVQKSITLSSEELTLASAKLTEARANSSSIRPEVVFSECFYVDSGVPCQTCQVCTSCRTFFGFELCDPWREYCWGPGPGPCA